MYREETGSSMQIKQIEVGEGLNAVYNKIAWHKKVQVFSIVSAAFLLITIVVKSVQIVSQLIIGFYSGGVPIVTDILALLLTVSLAFLFQQIFGLHTVKRTQLEQTLIRV